MALQSPLQPPLPTSEQDFVLLRKIGQGSFAHVQKVMHKATGRTFALKTIDRSRVESVNFEHQLMNEVRLHGSMHHPNVLRCYHHFEEGSSIYMVLELCEKGELYQYMKKNPGKMIEAEIARLFVEVVHGVQYLHSLKVIHRDLKPENILLDDELHAKLADFGWCTQLKSNRTTFCGTPCMLAPEMVSRKGHDHRVDYWALGVLLFEMLAGYSPFEAGGTVIETCQRIVNVEYGRGAFQSIPPAAHSLIRGLLTKTPETRMSPKQILEHQWVQKVFVGDPMKGFIEVRLTMHLQGAGDALVTLQEEPEGPDADAERVAQAEADAAQTDLLRAEAEAADAEKQAQADLAWAEAEAAQADLAQAEAEAAEAEAAQVEPQAAENAKKEAEEKERQALRAAMAERLAAAERKENDRVEAAKKDEDNNKAEAERLVSQRKAEEEQLEKERKEAERRQERLEERRKAAAAKREEAKAEEKRKELEAQVAKSEMELAQREALRLEEAAKVEAERIARAQAQHQLELAEAQIKDKEQRALSERKEIELRELEQLQALEHEIQQKEAEWKAEFQEKEAAKKMAHDAELRRMKEEMNATVVAKVDYEAELRSMKEEMNATVVARDAEWRADLEKLEMQRKADLLEATTSEAQAQENLLRRIEFFKQGEAQTQKRLQSEAEEMRRKEAEMREALSRSEQATAESKKCIETSFTDHASPSKASRKNEKAWLNSTMKTLQVLNEHSTKTASNLNPSSSATDTGTCLGGMLEIEILDETVPGVMVQQATQGCNSPKADHYAWKPQSSASSSTQGPAASQSSNAGCANVQEDSTSDLLDRLMSDLSTQDDQIQKTAAGLSKARVEIIGASLSRLSMLPLDDVEVDELRKSLAAGGAREAVAPPSEPEPSLDSLMATLSSVNDHLQCTFPSTLEGATPAKTPVSGGYPTATSTTAGSRTEKCDQQASPKARLSKTIGQDALANSFFLPQRFEAERLSLTRTISDEANDKPCR